MTVRLDNSLTKNTGDSRYIKVDQTTPQIITGDGSIGGLIPQLTSDPSPLVAETAWVLREGSGGAIADGTPIGLLLALTYTDNAGVAYSYKFKYRTKEGTTIVFSDTATDALLLE